MADPFPHLHVASGYSLRYGTASPAALVRRAAEHGMESLALTDRDGLYGAVRFALACEAAGLHAVLGADLAVAEPCGDRAGQRPGPAGPPGPGSTGTPTRGSAARGGATRGSTARRTPAHGGTHRDRPAQQRVTVLAAGAQGWAGLCRLVSAAHRDGGRGRPLLTVEALAEEARRHDGHLVVLLGRASGPVRALARRRPDLARMLLRPWVERFGPAGLAVEVVHHRGPGELAAAARLAGFAAEEGLPAVITNEVRYLDRSDAVVADLLDAARRLVPLGPGHVDRRTGEGYLKSGKEMALLAEEVARAAGVDDGGRGLLARTRVLADRCALDPRAGLGLGRVHLPELSLLDPSGGADGDRLLRARCQAGLGHRGLTGAEPGLRDRLDSELAVIAGLGYASYFLTVADVVALIRGMGVRCAARGSGAGSLVAYLTGVSEVDPLRYGLLMERFLSPLRRQLPDIDIDVESHRRTDVYTRVIERFGVERSACVAMVETYRARHALREVGAALGLPPGEIDALAKAFPRIRAGQLRAALRDLPELRGSGLAEARLDVLFRLAERLDGLPRHVAVHPCGVVLSDATLLDRAPVEASLLGFPMLQFDKDDVEQLGLLKLDLLGVRMQSAIAHALGEIARVDGDRVDIDAVPRDDPATFELIRSTHTLGCFQIESPGQRELVGRFAPERFEDLLVDISLFRPGPVNSDMVQPFLAARQGWSPPVYPHPDLVGVLAETEGVVVFHEQVLRIVATMTGVSLAEADEVRRALGDPDGLPEARAWFVPAALRRGYSAEVAERVWSMLQAFGSFGFCKAHAAAFAVPTYQSAWLKAHHPAAFLAGVLTHDPGMYPKRLILADARRFGIAVLPLDVNSSGVGYHVERVGILDEPPPVILDQEGPRAAPPPGLPDARGYGIRLGLAEVVGISRAEIERVVAGRPYRTLSDFWHRAAPSRPVAERLVVAGAFDSLYGLGSPAPVRRRGQVTRRDLLVQVAELSRSSGARTPRASRSDAGRAVPAGGVQLTLDLGDDPGRAPASGLRELSDAERVRAELEALGLDASRHVMDFYAAALADLGVTPAGELLGCRNRQVVLVAGAKVATQTPPVRSGRRVVFLTLDDATGPVDITLFEDAQLHCAATVFHSWLLLVRGEVRRRGPRGVSLRALGCWELSAVHEEWRRSGRPGALRLLAWAPPGRGWSDAGDQAGQAAAAGPGPAGPGPAGPGPAGPGPAGPAVYATGFRRSPYADVRPPGPDGRGALRRLYHASPGSSGG